jgi:hypothetical protein
MNMNMNMTTDINIGICTDMDMDSDTVADMVTATGPGHELRHIDSQSQLLTFYNNKPQTV